MTPSSITAPSFGDLRAEFKFIENEALAGVPAVRYISDERRGPTRGLTIGTHGNEPSGLAALWFLRNKFDLSRHVQCGNVCVVLNKFEATRDYLETLDLSDGPERTKRKATARFSDVNMKHLPELVNWHRS